MPDNTLSRVAYGTINPMRFVQDAPGIINGALQCTGPGVPIAGIAMESTAAMMGTLAQQQFSPQGYPAAVSGMGLHLYGENGPETMVIVGSGVTVLPDQLLISDASGNAVGLNYASAAAGTHWIGGRAIEGGDAGNAIRVQPFNYRAITKPA